MRGITGVEEVISQDEDVEKFRKSGISTVVQLGKDVYALDMMASDGHNAMDVMYANQICNSLALNEMKGIFKPYQLKDLSLTYKVRPSFVMTYYDAEGELSVWGI